MKKLALLATISISLLSCKEKKDSFPPLEFLGIYQLDSLHGLKFDLSGIVEIEDSVFIIADKPWNKFLYKLEFSGSGFRVASRRNLSFRDKLDLEGVDYCNGSVYLVNERQGLVYRNSHASQVEILSIAFDSINVDPSSWGNAGWEGVAVDCASDILYLIKERHPRRIYSVDMKNMTVLSDFTIPETESDDFSDAKFENGHLYVIERNGNYVTKIDPENQEVVAKYQYRKIASNTKGKLFGPTEYGMGEALLLTRDEIWIGLDNNGLKATDYATETFGITGKSPVILKFKRPQGF